MATANHKAMKPRLKGLYASIFTLCLGLSGSVAAAEYREAASNQYFGEQPSISLETATAIVRSKTGGRVLSTKPIGRGGERGFRVRVLIDDRVVQTWVVDERGRAANQ